MNTFYITGDIHGDIKRIKDFVDKNKTSINDVLILLGDVGLNYFLNDFDTKRKKELSLLPITLFCIYGNHECRPNNISNYKLITFCKGQAYQEFEFPNILFSKDGCIYEFNKKFYIVIGGAYSVDKHYRLMMGYRWFEDEQPSLKVKKIVEKQLNNYDWNIHGVLSHTCPLETQPKHLFLENLNQSLVDSSTEAWLQKIKDKLTFNIWYFGHYHDNWKNNKYQMLYNDIMKLD